jgi:hypothetical protein
MIRAMLFMLLVLSSTRQSTAQGLNGPFRVGLTIKASDESQKNAIQSYMSRELRRLGDVEVVDGYDTFIKATADANHKPVHYGIRVLANRQLGMFSMAVIFLRPYNIVPLWDFLKTLPDELFLRYYDIHKANNGMGLHMASGDVYLTMSLHTGGDAGDQLKEACERIVIGFDTDVLNDARKDR